MPSRPASIRSFRVLDQPQADTLLYELIDRELRRRLAEREESVLDLVVQFGLAGLRDMVRQLLAQAAGNRLAAMARWRPPAGLAGPLGKLLARRHAAAGRPTDRPPAGRRTILRILRDSPPSHPLMRERAAVLLEYCQHWCSQRGKRGQSPFVRSTLRAGTGRRLVTANGDCPLFQRLAAIRENARVQGGGGKKAWPSEAVYEAFRDRRRATPRGSRRRSRAGRPSSPRPPDRRGRDGPAAAGGGRRRGGGLSRGEAATGGAGLHRPADRRPGPLDRAAGRRAAEAAGRPDQAAAGR